MTGEVYEKFDPGLPGLLRKAERQLGIVPHLTRARQAAQAARS